MPRRISVSEVPDITRKLLQMQGNKCAICGNPMTARDRPALDHDHDTGIVRGVLHNSCNGAEGKVKVKAHRGHKGVSAADYIIGLGKYLEKHKKPQTKIIHHSHLTEDEKRIKRNKRARVLRARKKASAS